MASIISRVGFALSKTPHFNGAYFLRVPFSSGIAVFVRDFHFRLNYQQIFSLPFDGPHQDLNL